MKTPKPMPKKPNTMPSSVPPGKYQGQMSEYDSNRPKRQIMTRVSK